MDASVGEAIAVTQRVSPNGIHDVNRREWMLLRLGNSSECNAVAVEVLPSAISNLAFRVPDWNGDVQNCNEPATPLTFVECALR